MIRLCRFHLLVTKLVVFYSIFTKMIAFEVYFVPTKIIKIKFNGSPSKPII